MSALASDKADKYEYLTGEEMPPQDRSRVIERAKCSYFPSGKAFEK